MARITSIVISNINYHQSPFTYHLLPITYSRSLLIPVRIPPFLLDQVRTEEAEAAADRDQ